uniref:Apple domain-containing protein n=1 Tax=Meloidogyne hapla TaxID=6305 RepID=A0A1I8B4D5_MELHA
MILNFLLLIPAISVSAELHKFHHCFDRYNNRKIIGGQFIQPFHSEWRIGGGEARCIGGESRCTSIVFDKHQHICHYFSIGGLHNVVPARGFVYLQLISKECVDDEKILQNINSTSPEPQQDKAKININRTVTIPQPIIVTPRKDKGSENKNVSFPLINKKLLEENDKQINGFSKQEVEEFLLNEEHFSVTTTTEKQSEQAETEDSISFLEEIDKELREKEEENPESEELEDSPQQSNLMPTLQMLKIKKRPKQLGEEPEIRRHPRLDNSINNEYKQNSRVENYLRTKQQNRVGKINKLQEENSGCGTGKQPIWVAVENARFSPSSIDQSTNDGTTITAETSKECARFCANTSVTFIDDFGRRRRCNAFSFNENEKLCELVYSNVEFPSTLVQIPEADFSQRAFRRLCYAANFPPFSGCSDFLSFMDYRLNDVAISPRELFDGLPQNIQGLSACIELCVLANDFNCLSGFFDALKGRCTLYDVNSLSNPSAFCKHTGNGHQLYFENGCVEPDKDVTE